MQVLMYGDLQVNRQHATYSDFLEKSMQKLYEVCKYANPDLVINMGDLLDTHHVVDVEDLVWAWNWTRKIEAQCPCPSEDGIARHWIVKGNHDISDRNTSIASVSVMEGVNTQVFLEPIYVKVNGIRILVLPYMGKDEVDYADMRGWLDFGDEAEKIDLIIGHVEWIGARYTPYRTSDIGLDPVEIQRRFPNATIFNGHYHHPDSTDRLHMVGSPLHKDFNDVVGELPRGFVLYDTDLKTITRIENPHTYYCLSFEFQDEQNMIETAQGLQEDKDRIRAKVSVPQGLVDEAEDQFKGFLWKSVTPMDSSVSSIYQGAGLKVCSSPGDVVNRGVEIAPEGFETGLLAEIGKEAFNV